MAVHVCGGLKPWTAGSSSRYWIATAFGLAMTVGEGLAMTVGEGLALMVGPGLALTVGPGLALTAAFRHCEEAKPTRQSMSAVA